MLNPELKINEEFKEQVEINVEKSFSGTTMMPVRKLLQKGNTRVLSIVMFYENRKNMKFKVLSSIVYCIIDNFFCVDYLCCPKTTLHVTSKEKYLKTEHTMLFQELAFLNY